LEPKNFQVHSGKLTVFKVHSQFIKNISIFNSLGIVLSSEMSFFFSSFLFFSKKVWRYENLRIAGLVFPWNVYEEYELKKLCGFKIVNCLW
jgi:hypothetical protein